MSIKFRKEVLGFKPYVQGKTIEKVKEEYGLSSIEKLASNENHFGIPKKTKEKLIKKIDSINFYPDGSGKNLKEEIKKRFKVDTKNIVLGTGGEQLILLLCLALIEKGSNIVVPKPTFDLYKMMCSLMGGKTKEVPLRKDFSYDTTTLLKKIDKKTKMVIVTTPNNPTGNILSKKDIEELIKKVPKGCLLVLDEAYYEYAKVFTEYNKETKEKLKKRENIAIIRTFSKAHSLAGLRIGYLFTNKETAEKLNAINLTFGINSLASEAAVSSLSEKKQEEFVIKENKKQLDFLYKEFEKLGLPYVKSYGNFVWVDVKKNSKTVFEELQKRGIIIRAGFHWGFDNFIRVSTGTEKQMKKFIKALKEVL